MSDSKWSMLREIEEAVSKLRHSDLRDLNAATTLREKSQDLLHELNRVNENNSAAEPNLRKRKISDSAISEDEPERKKSKLDLPTIPCIARSAHTIYMQEMRDEYCDKHPKLSIAERTKLVSEAWKNVNPDQRAVYKQKEKQDRDRYERELAEYVAKGGIVREKPKFEMAGNYSNDSESSSRIQAARKRLLDGALSRRDPNRPQLPRTAYLCFTTQNRYFGGGLETERLKAHARWAEMTAEQKQPYYQQAALDKERYDREIREYDAQKSERSGDQIEIPGPEPRNHNKEKTRKRIDSDSSSSSDSDSSSSSEERPRKRRTGRERK